MTIFVTWQLIVTLDSIRNSCDVLLQFYHRPWFDCDFDHLKATGASAVIDIILQKSVYNFLWEIDRNLCNENVQCAKCLQDCICNFVFSSLPKMYLIVKYSLQNQFRCTIGRAGKCVDDDDDDSALTKAEFLCLQHPCGYWLVLVVHLVLGTYFL